MADEATIVRAAQLLHEAAPDARIILFGSYARGDQRGNSDLDFLVIEPDTPAVSDEAARLRRALRPLPVSVDVLVTSQATFRRWAGRPGMLYYDAAREGREFRFEASGPWLAEEVSPARAGGDNDVATPREHAELLLRKAAEDEFVLSQLASNPMSPDSVIGFHAQQAVEKLMKAALADRSAVYERTHDLATLEEALAAAGLPIPHELHDLHRLNDFAVAFRYDDLPPPSRALERAWATDRVQRTRAWVESVIYGHG